MIKIWVDDVREAPPGWQRCCSVNDTIDKIKFYGQDEISCISLDHDAGMYYYKGGDYVKILDWIERVYGKNWACPIHIHSKNPVDVQNMRAIIHHNNWKEIY